MLSILTLEGPDRISIESVAARTGVAKTSIYRRYAHAEEMIDDALARSADLLAPPPLPFDGAQDWTQPQWTRALDSAVRVLIRDLGSGTAIALLGDPGSERARILRRRLLGPRLVQLHELLSMQARAGRLGPEPDLDILVDFVLGSAYAHVARYGALEPDWAERVRAALIR